MPQLSPTLRKMPIEDVEAVLASPNIAPDEALARLIRNYHSGMTLTAAGRIKGISTHRASTLVHKFLRRCRHPSNWSRISDRSWALLQHPQVHND